ncbi:hypothetical protein N005_25980 [Pseudomonas mediterranea CFBP 5447]|nr:hypothetical protein N005_25980 [Pseudomonas mediterranea CFBP 5447]
MASRLAPTGIGLYSVDEDYAKLVGASLLAMASTQSLISWQSQVIPQYIKKGGEPNKVRPPFAYR